YYWIDRIFEFFNLMVIFGTQIFVTTLKEICLMKGKLSLLVSALFVVFQSSAQTGEKIAFGPYIQQMSTKDAAICWSTLEGGVTLTNDKGNIDTIREYKQHTVYLANLQPDTNYDYDVLNDGSDEGKGTLTTFPEKKIPFNFVAMGDTRSRKN